MERSEAKLFWDTAWDFDDHEKIEKVKRENCYHCGGKGWVQGEVCADSCPYCEE